MDRRFGREEGELDSRVCVWSTVDALRCLIRRASYGLQNGPLGWGSEGSGCETLMVGNGRRARGCGVDVGRCDGAVFGLRVLFERGRVWGQRLMRGFWHGERVHNVL